MKRALNVTTLLAMGFLMATPPATAQNALAGQHLHQQLRQHQHRHQRRPGDRRRAGRDNVDSSKFTEYREVPKGVSVPCFNLFSTSSKVDFNLFGYNVRQTDQRYNGWFNTSAFDLSFDYNQIPHNMGNDAHTIQAELSQGVWGMSDTLQQVAGHHRRRDTDRRPDRDVLRHAARPDVRLGRQRRRLEHAQARDGHARPRQEAPVRPDLHLHAGAQVRLSRRRRRRRLQRRQQRRRGARPAERDHAGLRGAGGLQLHEGQRPRLVRRATSTTTGPRR